MQVPPSTLSLLTDFSLQGLSAMLLLPLPNNLQETTRYLERAKCLLLRLGVCLKACTTALMFSTNATRQGVISTVCFFRMEGSLNSISGLRFASFKVSRPSLILVLHNKAEFKPAKGYGGVLFE